MNSEIHSETLRHDNQDKGENLASSRRKSSHRRGSSVRLSADFSLETSEARRQWADRFRVLKGKKYIYTPAKNLLSSKTVLKE